MRVKDHTGKIGFNSRAREGRDFRRSAGAGGEVVSIHAPARGATEAGV